MTETPTTIGRSAGRGSLHEVLAALVQCLTVLRRIDRDNLTVGAGTIHMTPKGIEPPLYGQMQSAIKASEAAIASNSY